MHRPVTTHGRLRRSRNPENGIHSAARPAWLSTYSSIEVAAGKMPCGWDRSTYEIIAFASGKLKNEHRTPIDIDIPLHRELEASIATAPSGHLTFLVTEFGRPFPSAGFGNWFRDQCDKANLHHCSAHGLRKATAAALAEAGASTHEIAAVTGHMSLEEIERYTRAARKKKLADAAMAKLK
jgi:integrase